MKPAYLFNVTSVDYTNAHYENPADPDSLLTGVMLHDMGQLDVFMEELPYAVLREFLTNKGIDCTQLVEDTVNPHLLTLCDPKTNRVMYYMAFTL